MKYSSKNIAFFAVILALMILLTPLPYVFFVPLLTVCCVKDFKTSVIAGLIFGTVSLGYAFMGATPVSYAFMQAPWIPIVARVVTAALTSLIYKLINKLIKKEGRFKIIFSAALTSVFGSLLNTLTVGGSILLFAPTVAGADGDIIMSAVLPALLAVSAPIESVINALIVPLICLALSKVLKPEKKKLTHNSTDGINLDADKTDKKYSDEYNKDTSDMINNDSII